MTSAVNTSTTVATVATTTTTTTTTATTTATKSLVCLCDGLTDGVVIWFVDLIKM